MLIFQGVIGLGMNIDYPPGNDIISHQTGIGKSSSKVPYCTNRICKFPGGYTVAHVNIKLDYSEQTT